MTTSAHSDNNDLLQQSKFFFAQRKLEEAHWVAQKALHNAATAEGERPSPIYVEAKLLLLIIYNKAGQYNAKPIYFDLAEQLANELLAECDDDNELVMQMLYEQGSTALFRSVKLSVIETYFKALLERAERQHSIKGKILANLGFSKINVEKNQFKEALHFAELAKTHLGKRPNDNISLKLEVYNQLLLVVRHLMDYERLAELAPLLLRMSQEALDIEKEITALNALGILYGTRADYTESIRKLTEALEKSTNIGYRYGIANCLINIGTVYGSLDNYEEALHNYKSVIRHFNNILSINKQIIIINNIGNIYYTTGEPTEAIQYFSEALSMLQNTEQNDEMMARLLSQISRCLLALGHFEQAKEKAEAAQNIINRLNNFSGKQINLINLATIQHKAGHSQTDALELARQSVEESKRAGDKTSEMRAYWLIANIHVKNNQYKEAYESQLAYSQVRDELAKAKQNRQFLDIQIKHALHEKEREIKVLQQENRYQALLIEQAKKIKEQNELLKEANEDLKQFAYIVSHDLRQPIRMISTYMGLLKKNLFNQFSEDEKLYTKFIQEGSERMKQLLDDLLHFSTIGTTKLVEMTTVDVNFIFEDVCQNLYVSMHDNQAVVLVDRMPTITSNPRFLTQILQNLIGNAIKFKRKDTTPIIKITYTKENELHLFKISDNGIGIPKDAKDRVFQIFQRLHKTSEYEGTGIGLSICKKMVRRLGGEIWIESSSQETGTTFSFHLPEETPTHHLEPNAQSA